MFKNGISVVVPAYNAEVCIEKCLSALDNQEFDASLYEVIIVNDGSTDNTLSIVRNFQSIRGTPFRVVDIPHSGAGRARNRGIEKAQYRILGFTDSDCIPDPHWLRTIYDELSYNKKTILTGFTYTYDTVIYPWKSAPIGQEGITANLALTGYDENIPLFYEQFGGMFGEDTEYVLRLRSEGYEYINVPEMRVLHPVNVLSFSKLLKRVINRQNEVLLFKVYGNKVDSSFHFIFRPIIFGRISIFTVLFCIGILSIFAIVYIWGIIGLLFALFSSYLIFHFSLYRYSIMYQPEGLYISHSERFLTYLYNVIMAPVFIFSRIYGTLKYCYVYVY